MAITWDDARSEVIFTSGRRAYVFAQTVGLALFDDDDDWRWPEVPSYGSDGTIWNWGSEQHQPGDLELEDKLELANLMIERWTKFRDALTKSRVSTREIPA